MFDNILIRCGLTATEQTLLLHLLQFGAAPAGALAKATKIKRPTVYAALEDLLQLGVVSREKTNAGTLFAAIEKDHIPKILEQKARRRFEDEKSNIHVLDTFLEQLPQTDKIRLAAYEIGVLETGEAVYAQLFDILRAGDFCAIFNPAEIPKHQRETVVLDFLKHTAITKATIREIVAPGPIAQWYSKNIKNRNHHIKELTPNINIISDMIFINGAVLISHYSEGRELAIRIREDKYYTSMLNIFEALWAAI